MKKKWILIILCLAISTNLLMKVQATETLTIYVDDGNADYLKELNITGEQDADYMIQQLIRYQMLPEGTKVNSFEIMKENDHLIGKLDLSKEYAYAIAHTGVAGEMMYVYSVVNTLIKNFNLDQIKLCVDGKILSSGHVIYDENLEFYDHVEKSQN